MRGWPSLALLVSLTTLPGACGGHSRQDAAPPRGVAGATGASGAPNPQSAGTAAETGGQGPGTVQPAGGSSPDPASDGGGGAMPTASGELPAAPPGCQSVGHYVESKMCTLSFECGSVPLFTRCDSNADGTWRCQCTPANGGASIDELVLEGASAETACGAMATACFTVPSAGEESCRRLSEDFAPDECSIEETCGPKFEVEAGITALGGERHAVTCRPSEAGFSCTCEPELIGKRDLSVSAPSIDLVCEHVLHACKAGLPPSEAALTCTDAPTDPGELGNPATACGLARSCTQLGMPGDGVSVRSSLERNAICSVGAAGSRDLFCRCEDGMVSSLSFSANAELEGACQTALDACTGATELEPDGLPECKLASYDLGEQQCAAKLTCTRASKLGGLKIVAEGEARLLCQQPTAGAHWWCSCDSRGLPKIFELGPAPSAFDACARGLDRCVEAVDIGFGLHPRAPLPPAPI